MPRIGFLSLYAPGHVHPSLALARGLQQKGYEVVFFNLPDVRPSAEGAGVPFVAFGEEVYPAGALNAVMKKTGELTGPEAMAYYVERMIRLMEASFSDLPERLRAADLDLVVVDQLFPGAATVADHAHLPFISLAAALPVNREETIPPPTLPWLYDPSLAGIARNAQGWAGTLKVFSPLLELINTQRQAWGLPVYTDFFESSFSPLAQIAQQAPALELPRPQAPSNLHLVGPLRDRERNKDVAFPWDWLDGRPLVYASLGTLQNGLEWVFRAILESCATLDAQTVVVLGRNALAPETFGELPPNLLLVPYAPQIELLERASLCITHAGMNTALDALAAGVPMVAIPIASEQPGIAARIVCGGYGEMLTLPELNAEALRAKIDQVLTVPKYREAARTAAASIAAMRPMETAVQVVEAVLKQENAAAV